MKIDNKCSQLIQLPNLFLPNHKDDLLRIGSLNDGGYVLTKGILDKTEFLLSFGLSFDWTFEQDFFEKKRKNILIHVYDHTVGKRAFRKFTQKAIINLIRKPLDKNNLENVFKFFAYRKFFNQNNITHFKERVWWRNYKKNITIEKIFERIDNNLIFLKIDIDGTEYRVIENILEQHTKIVGMVIEFHEVDILYESWIDLVEKIKKDFNIVHIHANNFSEIGIKEIPNVWEITFENKKFFGSPLKPSNHSYPIKEIDMPNNRNKSDFSIEFI